MADLELGNLAFNSNRNQSYNCPLWVVALLREIDNQLSRVMWNLTQKLYESPFDNSANTFKNDVFEVQAYNWNDEVEQQYNFKCGVVEISWYKYLGRDTTIDDEYDPLYLIQMFDKCIASIVEMEQNLMGEREKTK